MSQLASGDAKINTLKLSSQGQVTLSKEARQQHGLMSGETLIEISVPGCIILLPQSQVLADLMHRAQLGLDKMGLTVEEIKARVEARRKEELSVRYPDVFDG
jgi:hypothetical protein